MRIGCFGDLHLTDRRPKNRCDENYLQTWADKFVWAMTEPLSECRYVILPGDVFDSFKASYFLVQYFTTLLCSKFPKVRFLAIYGQHDLRFHNSNKLNTPLRVVESAGGVVVLDPAQPYFDHEEGVRFFGAGWGEEIPEVPESNRDTLNVLVTHRMVLKDEKLWDGQTEYSMAQVLLRKHPFDLIVSGDNHQCFTSRSGTTKWLVNMGSLMRSSIAQVHHRPSVVVYDTGTRKVKVFEIPIKEVEKVFKVKEAAMEVEKSEQLEAFIEGLSKEINIEGLDFKENLRRWVEENEGKVSEGVVDIIKEVAGGKD